MQFSNFYIHPSVLICVLLMFLPVIHAFIPEKKLSRLAKFYSSILSKIPLKSLIRLIKKGGG